MDHTDSITTPQETPRIPTILSIPEISDERLLGLYSHIKPIVGGEDGKKHKLKDLSPKELRDTRHYPITEDHGNIIDKTNLETIQDFYCLNSYGSYTIFNFSVAEVLSQIPEETIGLADFFEVIEWPRHVDDFHKDIQNAGFHLTKVRTYSFRTEE